MSRMFSIRRVFAVAMCLIVAGLLLAGIGPVAAQGGGKPALDVTGLLGKMGANGSVRVIVGLTTPYQMDAELPAPAAQAQQSAIQNAQQAVISGLAGTFSVNARYTFIPYMALEVDTTALQALAANPAVASIEEDIVLERGLSDSIPLVGANSAWLQGYDGTGQAVAIIDDGVDKNHEFFTSRVVSEACYTTDCPGGAGFGTGKGLPCTGCTHGTHVAGIAAGRGSTFSGVARGANIIAIRVFAAGGGASYSDVILALQRVYDLRNTYKIASVNMSLGSAGSFYTSTCDTANPAMKTVIDNLKTAGIATVIASGNYATYYGYFINGISFPACISSAVSVGNTTKADAVNSSSQSASYLSLLAPGTSIYSSVPGTGTYGYKTGTSMAAPHVAGAMALLRHHDPSLTVNEMVSAFQQTGAAILDTRNSVTKRRISILPAMTYYINNETVFAYNTPPLGYSTSQNPQAASKNAGDPQPSCVSTGNFTETVWYKYLAPTTRDVTINTSGSSYDTVLSVYRSTATAPNQVACNDQYNSTNQSQVSVRLLANTTYYIMVSKWGTTDFAAPATLYLRMNKTVVANTLFANATNIPWYSQWWDIDGTGKEGTDPTVCGSSNYQNSIWFKYVAPVTRVMQVNTHGSYIYDSGYYSPVDTVLGVYTGSPGAFTQRGCNDQADGKSTSRTTFSAVAGTTYYIMVGKFGSTPADRVMMVHLTLTHGADTTGIWRSGNSTFYLRNAFSGPSSFVFPFGASTDIPLVGDWNGDGIDTVGIYRPSNNTFYLRNSNTGGPADIVLTYGAAGDLPIVGDWGGLGRTGIGLRRPSTGAFYLKNVASAGPTDFTIYYGASTDKPIVGDWDGDGIDTVGLWRQSSAFWYFSNTHFCNGCVASTAASGAYGLSTDKPIVGDWNADKFDTPGIFRNGTWYMRTGLTTGGSTMAAYGGAGDTPLAGKYAFKATPDEPTAPSFVPKQ